MLDWASSLWPIFGVLAVPLIWWLHRLRHPPAATPVSAVFLWDHSTPEIAEGTRVTRADPRWRRRALAAFCLSLAAAQFVWVDSTAKVVEVWFDDTLSMLARESGGTRHAMAAEELLRSLERTDPDQVTVHSLAQPGKTLALRRAGRPAWRDQLVQWLKPEPRQPFLPVPALLSRDAEHWLVSDGAHPAVGAWVGDAPIARTLWVGTETENVAVTNLSLRRSLRDPALLVGLVKVANLGNADARRRLSIAVGGRPVLEEDLILAPGEEAPRSFSIAVGEDAGTGLATIATIMPPDALPVDDRLAIDPASIRPAAASLGAACGRHVRAALRADTTIRLVAAPGSSASLAIACGETLPEGAVPAIWFRRSRTSSPLRQIPVWHRNAEALQDLVLKPEWLRRVDGPRPEAGIDVLLSTEDTPLILEWRRPRHVVEVRLDLDSPDFVRQPEFPALVAGLVDYVTGRSLLDNFTGAYRTRELSTIKPQNRSRRDRSVTAEAARHVTDLTPYFIAAALVLLLLDIVGVGAWARPQPPGSRTQPHAQRPARTP